MKTSPAARAAAVTLASIVLLAGCTGDDEPSAEAQASPSEQPTAIITPPGDGLGASPSPTEPIFEDENRVLRVAIREPSTLDPMRIQDPGSVLIARQLFEGLTRWDQATESVQPAAAEAWKISDGGKTFTFKLRDGMTFHDGTPVTAADFEFAFDRITLKASGSDVAYLLELVQGFDQVNQLGDAKQLKGVSAPNDKTLVIKLTEPYRNFPAVLTNPSLVPAPKQAVKNLDEFLLSPVGNGPFQVAKSFEIGQPVVLEAFDDFYEPASIEGVRFIPYSDAADSWPGFVDGELDVAEVPTSEIDLAAEAFGEDGYVPLLVGAYYGFNLDSKQLDNKKLRVAINRAIDRSTIADEIYKGTLEAPRGIVPSGMPGFEDTACNSLCDYSLQDARELVRKLPKKQRAVALEYTTEAPQRKVARAIAQDLEAAGLDVKLEALKFTKFLKVLSRGDHSMYRLGWIAEYPDPDVFLSALFETASPDNHSGLASNKVDKLLTEARSAKSDAARSRLYQKAEKAVLKAAPIAPLGGFVMHWVAQPDVAEITFDVLGGFDANTIELDRG